MSATIAEPREEMIARTFYTVYHAELCRGTRPPTWEQVRADEGNQRMVAAYRAGAAAMIRILDPPWENPKPAIWMNRIFIEGNEGR